MYIQTDISLSHILKRAMKGQKVQDFTPWMPILEQTHLLLNSGPLGYFQMAQRRVVKSAGNSIVYTQAQSIL